MTTSPHIEHDPRRKRVRKVYLLPNLFTAFNLFLGLLAIYNVLGGHIEKACWLIVLAGVLDCLDGVVARLTHTQSEFGQQFDSLSDLVSFGVAPSLAAFSLIGDMGAERIRLVAGVCALFAICGALRLARYNVQAKGSERRGFLGLPIPGAALGVVFFILLILEYNLDASQRVLVPLGPKRIVVGPFVSAILPFVMLGLALLMVSWVPYPKVVQKLRLRRHMSFDTLVTVILLLVLLIALKSDLRVAVGFLLLWGYILGGVGIYVYRAISQGSLDPASNGQKPNASNDAASSSGH